MVLNKKIKVIKECLEVKVGTLGKIIEVNKTNYKIETNKVFYICGQEKTIKQFFYIPRERVSILKERNVIRKICGKELNEMLKSFYGEKEYYKNRRKLIKGYRIVEKQSIKEIKIAGSTDNWYINSDRNLEF